MSRAIVAPMTSRQLTHVLLQPVINPTPAACHAVSSVDDVVPADHWRRSLVIDTSEPYVSVVSNSVVLVFSFVTYQCYIFC